MWFNSDEMYWHINHLRRNVLECGSLEAECIEMWFTCGGTYSNVVHLRRNVAQWDLNVVQLRLNVVLNM